MQISQFSDTILYSCYTSEKRNSERFVSDHAFGYIQQGELEFTLADRKVLFKEGDHYFVSRNQLCKSVKYPGKSGEFKSVSVFFSQQTLREFSSSRSIAHTETLNRPDVINFSKSLLLQGYFDSLSVYNNDSITEDLLRLKIEEGILLLLHLDNTMKAILFDFSMPGKVDLVAYMNKHFRFNENLERFAFLTGRSLATFKRDFEKLYHTTPNRWLQKKRLEEAYYMITEKKMKPTEVYLEVGFEDLSHFSFAFKKVYGVGPSLV